MGRVRRRFVVSRVRAARVVDRFERRLIEVALFVRVRIEERGIGGSVSWGDRI
jgi:hypothetical protein